MASENEQLRPEDEELLAEIKAKLPTIDEMFDSLAHDEEVSAVAVGGCLLRFAETAPRLRALLERAADGPIGENEAELLFRGLHILGGGRDPLSFPPLLRLLRRPVEELDRLLGDAVTETLPKIVAGVFDGDADALFQSINDPALDTFVRRSLFGAAAFLTWDGRIPYDEMIRFLEAYDDQRPCGDGDEDDWSGWGDAIALLGLRPLAPRLEQACRDGRIPDYLGSAEEFLDDLARAEAEPRDESRFTSANWGYIEDVYSELRDFRPTDADDYGPGDEDGGDFRSPQEPYVNPMRHIGRNDPCPCGSGKKAKKCCLAG